jgi:hypothetical protein
MRARITVRRGTNPARVKGENSGHSILTNEGMFERRLD